MGQLLMTSSPITAKKSESISPPEAAPIRLTGRGIVYALLETLRSVLVLTVLGLLFLFFSGGSIQLYNDANAQDGGDLDGLVPSPAGIYDSWQEHQERIINLHIPATLWVTLAGLSIGIVLGVALATIMDMFAVLRWLLYPVLTISQTVPIFAVAVLLIIVFGYADSPKIIVVTLFCFFPIAINTLNGFQSVDRVHVHLLRTMGANPLQTWWKVRLPTALPSFFSGLRIATTYSVVGAVIGEYVGSGNGLGKFLQRSYRSFNSDQTYLAIVIITLLSILLVMLTLFVEVLVTRWRYAGLFGASSPVQNLVSRIRSNLSKQEQNNEKA